MKTFEKLIYKGDIDLLKTAFDNYCHGIELPTRDPDPESGEDYDEEVIVDFGPAMSHDVSDCFDAFEDFGRLKAERDFQPRPGDEANPPVLDEKALLTKTRKIVHDDKWEGAARCWTPIQNLTASDGTPFQLQVLITGDPGEMEEIKD